MDREILERRKETLRNALMGEKTTAWVRKLADKYNVTERAIWEDWRKREEWIDKVYSSQDAVLAAKDLLAEKRTAREEAWKLYKNAENTTQKAQALKIIDRSTKEHINLLQSLGELERELGNLSFGEEGININIERVEDD